MAKEKDIKIIKRNGLDIQEIVTLNYVGDDLERYMFVYAQLKERLLQFNADGTEIGNETTKVILKYNKQNKKENVLWK